MDDQGVRRATVASTPEPARRVGIESQERTFSILSVVVALIGWFFADLFYRRKPGMADTLVERLRGVYALLVNKYWIDQIYNALIVTPLLVFSRYLLWGAVDRGVINGGARRGSRWRPRPRRTWSNACNPETFVPMQDGWQSAQAPSS